MDVDGLLTLQLVSKDIYCKVQNDKNCLCYWSILCINYAKKYGLYYHLKYGMNAGDAKRHILEDLFPSRHKWDTDEKPTAKSFKVRTMCRFRPGNSGGGKVLLPLHQFLKLRREKVRKQLENPDGAGTATNGEDSTSKFGQQIPEKYLDPVLGIVMKDPVKLTTSGQIIDRSVAVQCVVHGGRDPFNNEKLVSANLIPQPEFSKEIADWMASNMSFDPSVDVADLKPLVDAGNAVDPLLLEALMEAQQLATMSNKLYTESRASHARVSLQDYIAHNPYLVVEEQAEMEAEADAPETDDAPLPPSDADGQDFAEEVEAETDPAVRKKDAYRSLKMSDSPKIVDVSVPSSFVTMHIPGQGVTSFHFAKVFHENGGNASVSAAAVCAPGFGFGRPSASRVNVNHQRSVYEKSTKDAVLSVMNGVNACVLCYGQTGAGKTFSMMGEQGVLEKFHEQHCNPLHIDPNTGVSNLIMPECTGVVVRAFCELLEAKTLMQELGSNVAVVISAQFVEIYNEKCTDLLSGKGIFFRRDTGEPVGAMSAPVETMQDVLLMLHTGQQRKKFAATAMNDHSSRSHTALILTVSQSRPIAAEVGCGAEASSAHCSSSLFLVDLAGSERVKKSRAQGQQLTEAVGINRSLLVLGKVIASLSEGRAHVPYLESKLTTLLKQAFGGNCRTNVLIHCRSDEAHSEETLQSMRFGERCAMILNSVKAAATSKESTLLAIDEAVERMEKQLKALRNNNKEHLEAFKQVSASMNTLQLKRNIVADM